ncbi:hypothetical protein [Brevibacillus brevis]|uniref:hypothetical protein n=1 Tax=Brevibacillus brevis TaxID=1393 RepID=UPI000D0FDBFB|nr:hypothetical protein [Brevibacillus brevis]PSJ67332.1 hypothetical protein C7J99_21365 [Brevibacillus brevis]RED21679.1 hypothetical protein DES34_119106 [Brevibacillus brevis]GEC93922.1 hypothetical protein BBR01nite_62530 [Brevibacillus brevis]VEF86649.1 Uncharacterised protein [Brevibacillus brevis]
MPIGTKHILRDGGLLPIPQYFNATRDEFQEIQGNKGAMFVQLRGLSAKEPISGSADTDHIFNEPMYGFVIKNDGTNDLTFTINNYTFTVKEGEVFEDSFEPFTQVTIKTTSPFRAYGKG